MLTLIDKFLNRITMYRLALYVLIAFLLVAFIYSFFDRLPFGPIDLLKSLLIILALCWATNNIFAYLFKIPANVESFYITAFILTLIITPTSSVTFLGVAAMLAMASKYILAIAAKHIFNPAAIALVIGAFTLNYYASWWVGTIAMLPFVIVGGLLIARKIQRFDLVFSFLAAAVISYFLTSISRSNPGLLLQRIALDTPIFFFAFIMLTEPLTSPPTRMLRIIYGSLVGLMFAPGVHVGQFHSIPELALVIGNIFSYVVSPKARYLLKLKEKVQAASGTWELIFEPNRQAKFQPGQYLEWTVNPKSADNRGTRRYFTIASAPTEKEIRLGLRIYPNPSTFKQRLMAMQAGDVVSASSLAGEFVLPQDKNKKLAFVAGGIGITPFRSMLKYLMDQQERRDIVLFNSNKTAAEVAYKELLAEAEKKLGLKVINQLTETMGYLNEKVFGQIGDYGERIFYVSGPRSFVSAMEQVLSHMGVPSAHIKTDFFPGFV